MNDKVYMGAAEHRYGLDDVLEILTSKDGFYFHMLMIDPDCPEIRISGGWEEWYDFVKKEMIQICKELRELEFKGRRFGSIHSKGHAFLTILNKMYRDKDFQKKVFEKYGPIGIFQIKEEDWCEEIQKEMEIFVEMEEIGVL